MFVSREKALRRREQQFLFQKGMTIGMKGRGRRGYFYYKKKKSYIIELTKHIFNGPGMYIQGVG